MKLNNYIEFLNEGQTDPDWNKEAKGLYRALKSAKHGTEVQADGVKYTKAVRGSNHTWYGEDGTVNMNRTIVHAIATSMKSNRKYDMSKLKLRGDMKARILDKLKNTVYS